MRTPGDNPIKHTNEDLLSRGGVAKGLANEIGDLDASEGFVVAVMGPWGSGKTSLINLIRLELPNIVIDFNPWMFSGTEQLVTAFFTELAAQLKLNKGEKIAKIAGEIEAYGELFSPVLSSLGLVPVVGAWVDRVRTAAEAFKKLQEQRKKSVTEQRAELAKALASLEQPIVVVVDDIDRLETKEIRDMFKLVRLTGSFPNIIYLLAFDRARVEQALSQDAIDGRSYLEKIVQIGIDIPTIPEHSLLTRLGNVLDETLADVDNGANLDKERWPDTLMEVIKPLIKTMRDIRRYSITAKGTVRALSGKMELGYILALEAVRVFLPDVFTALSQAQDGLTTLSDGYGREYESPRLKRSIDHLLKVAGAQDGDVAKALIRRLFPAAQRHIGETSYTMESSKSWLRDRRAAYKDILSLYLERVASDGLLAFDVAEKAYPIMSDEKAFDKLLRSIPRGGLEDAIAALENFEGDYPLSAVVPASIVLLNLLPDMPEKERGMWDIISADLVITRVVLRLLRQLKSPGEVLAATCNIMPHITTLSAKFDLVHMVGYQKGAGHKMVSEEDASQIENNFVEEVRTASSQKLAKEQDLLGILLFAKRHASDKPLVIASSSSGLSARLLVASCREVRSQSIGNRAFKTETRLSWDVLVEILGSEDEVNKAVKSARQKSRKTKKLSEAIALAEHYLSGWRPERED